MPVGLSAQPWDGIVHEQSRQQRIKQQQLRRRGKRQQQNNDTNNDDESSYEHASSSVSSSKKSGTTPTAVAGTTVLPKEYPIISNETNNRINANIVKKDIDDDDDDITDAYYYYYDKTKKGDGGTTGGCNAAILDDVPIDNTISCVWSGRYILGLFFILLQCIVWIGGAVLTQYLYTVEEFRSPYMMSYIGLSLLSLCLPLRFVTESFRTNNTTTTTTPNDPTTITITTNNNNNKNIEDDNDNDTGSASPIVNSRTTSTLTTFTYDIHHKKYHPYTKQQLDDNDDDISLDVQLQYANTCTDYIELGTIKTQKYLNNIAEPKKIKKWNHKKHFIAAILLAPAMFIADYSFNIALQQTSVASATVLVSTQCIFVLVLAVLTRLESLSIIKIVGVILSFIGTALTAINDSVPDDDNNNVVQQEGNNGAVIGDMVAVLAAILYAVYTIQVRLYCPQDEELYSMQLLLGYIGIVSWIVFMPGALYVIITHPNLFETFTYTTGIILVAKGMMDFLITDYCLFRSILLTSPTVATVGLGMTIPMAFFVDWVMGKGSGIESIYSLLGAISVTIGFLIVNLTPEIPAVATTANTAGGPTTKNDDNPTTTTTTCIKNNDTIDDDSHHQRKEALLRIT